MKSIEQYFPVVLFILQYKVLLSFKSVDKILKCTSQMKAIQQLYLVELFVLSLGVRDLSALSVFCLT